jgi:hypothetical protein
MIVFDLLFKSTGLSVGQEVYGMNDCLPMEQQLSSASRSRQA